MPFVLKLTLPLNFNFAPELSAFSFEKVRLKMKNNKRQKDILISN